MTAPPRASTHSAKSDHVKVSPFRPVWFHARVWIDFVDRCGIPRGTTRSASSVHRHRAILDPSERQQAPKTINHGQRQRCATSICLSQPAHAPHPTRPRNRGASARVLPRDCARVREYPAWRQPAMQPGLRAPGPDRSPTPTRPAPRRPDGEVRSRVRSHAQGVRALGCARAARSRLAAAPLTIVRPGPHGRTRTMRKMEFMIPYWMARCPNRGWKDSPEYFKAEELREKMAVMEAKAKKRWEANFC